MTLLANMFNLHLGLGPYNAMQYIAGYFNFALIMDSDILFHKYGLIEAMKEILPEKFICCFKIGEVNIRGIGTTDRDSISYIHPRRMAFIFSYIPSPIIMKIK